MTAMSEQKFAEFFAVMTGIFGHKWVSQYGTEPTAISARVWNDGLASLNLQQIADAIRYYKNHSLTAFWPPSLPEFRAQALQIPSIAQVRYDLANKVNSPFVRLIRSKIDMYAFDRSDAQGAERMLKDAYSIAVTDLENGKHLPPEFVEIPVYHSKPVEITPEQIARQKRAAEKAKTEINGIFCE